MYISAVTLLRSVADTLPQIAASLPLTHAHGRQGSFRGGLSAAPLLHLHLLGYMQIPGFTHHRLRGGEILHVAALFL